MIAALVAAGKKGRGSRPSPTRRSRTCSTRPRVAFAEAHLEFGPPSSARNGEAGSHEDGRSPWCRSQVTSRAPPGRRGRSRFGGPAPCGCWVAPGARRLPSMSCSSTRPVSSSLAKRPWQVAGAARSLVLLGDPNQLPQVSQGIHPEGAGRCRPLEHLVGDALTRRSRSAGPAPADDVPDAPGRETATSRRSSTRAGSRRTRRRVARALAGNRRRSAGDRDPLAGRSSMSATENPPSIAEAERGDRCHRGPARSRMGRSARPDPRAGDRGTSSSSRPTTPTWR